MHLAPAAMHYGSDESQPRLLGEVLAFAPGRQLELPHRVLHEGLIPANKLVAGSPVTSLRRPDKSPGGRPVPGREAARCSHDGAW